MNIKQRAEAADYITALAKELSSIAFNHELKLAGYLLELAAAEADDNKRALVVDRASDAA